jgi:hypothetical protein
MNLEQLRAVTDQSLPPDTEVVVYDRTIGHYEPVTLVEYIEAAGMIRIYTGEE